MNGVCALKTHVCIHVWARYVHAKYKVVQIWQCKSPVYFYFAAEKKIKRSWFLCPILHNLPLFEQIFISEMERLSKTKHFYYLGYPAGLLVYLLGLHAFLVSNYEIIARKLQFNFTKQCKLYNCRNYCPFCEKKSYMGL